MVSAVLVLVVLPLLIIGLALIVYRVSGRRED
jgi:hypothetical protein